MDLALNNLQRLICHKPNQPTTMLFTYSSIFFRTQIYYTVILIEFMDRWKKKKKMEHYYLERLYRYISTSFYYFQLYTNWQWNVFSLFFWSTVKSWSMMWHGLLEKKFEPNMLTSWNDIRWVLIQAWVVLALLSILSDIHSGDEYR